MLKLHIPLQINMYEGNRSVRPRDAERIASAAGSVTADEAPGQPAATAYLIYNVLLLRPCVRRDSVNLLTGSFICYTFDSRAPTRPTDRTNADLLDSQRPILYHQLTCARTTHTQVHTRTRTYYTYNVDKYMLAYTRVYIYRPMCP